MLTVVWRCHVFSVLALIYDVQHAPFINLPHVPLRSACRSGSTQSPARRRVFPLFGNDGHRLLSAGYNLKRILLLRRACPKINAHKTCRLRITPVFLTVLSAFSHAIYSSAVNNCVCGHNANINTTNIWPIITVEKNRRRKQKNVFKAIQTLPTKLLIF